MKTGYNKGRYGGENTRSRAVLMFKDEILIKEFGALSEAAREYNTSPTEIWRACRNQNKKINGYSFKYK